MQSRSFNTLEPTIAHVMIRETFLGRLADGGQYVSLCRARKDAGKFDSTSVVRTHSQFDSVHMNVEPFYDPIVCYN